MTTGREYEESHPWITFDARKINDLGAQFWMLVGEAGSKCQHLAGAPLKPSVAAHLWEVTLIKGALATTAIEGNTLTQEQAERIFEGSYQAPESRQYQEQELRNVLDALQELDRRVMSGETIQLTPELICDFNRQILKGLELDDGIVPGEIRKKGVGVGRYRGAPAVDCEYLLDRLCGWLEGPDFRSDDAGIQFALTIASAILAHLYLAWVHPFGDGNGRTARLVEFLVLARSGRVPLPAAHLLSNHYNLTRDRYYRELDRASAASDFTGFLQYAVRGFVDGIREEIDQVRAQQFHVSWINFVHEVLDGEPIGKTCERRRSVALHLPFETPVPRSEIVGLTPKLAAMYARTGERTLARDLNRLQQLGLVRKVKNGYVANGALIAAFLPPMADPDDYTPDD